MTTGHVASDDLAGIVDAIQNGLGTQWIVERGETARARTVEEAVVVVGDIVIAPDDLAETVDPGSDRAVGSKRFVDAREKAPAQNKAVLPTADVIGIVPNDLTRIVDAFGPGKGGAGTIDGAVGAGTGVIDEAVGRSINVSADDQARGVDAGGQRKRGGERVVDRDIGAAGSFCA